MNATLKHLIHLQALLRQYENAGHPPGLRRQIDQARLTLPDAVLRRFDHVGEHRRVAVAPLSPSGACGVCHLKLPPAEVLRIRSSSHSLSVCPLCGGFLYAAEETVFENVRSTSKVTP
jgi:predicted  nucleic acid-binding Zn-ribbon protein